jgi:hypothetical protein
MNQQKRGTGRRQGRKKRYESERGRNYGDQVWKNFMTERNSRSMRIRREQQRIGQKRSDSNSG